MKANEIVNAKVKRNRELVRFQILAVVKYRASISFDELYHLIKGVNEIRTAYKLIALFIHISYVSASEAHSIAQFIEPRPIWFHQIVPNFSGFICEQVDFGYEERV